MVILLNKIYCPEEQQERAAKALRLNGGTDYNPTTVLATSSLKKKPTIRIKRLRFIGSNPNSMKLKGASSIQNQEREKAEKALRLNGIV